MLLPPLLLLLPLLWAGSLVQDPRFQLYLEPQVTVQEGQCALVFCKFSFPSIGSNNQDPAHGYWYKQSRSSSGTESALVATNNPAQQVKKETQGRFRLLGDSRDHNCSLDIRDARREDAGTYIFRLERGAGMKHDYTDHPLNVIVTALTQIPHIQLSGTFQSGHSSNITCSAPWACPRGTPPTFTWTGEVLPSGSTDSPGLSLTPGPQHHGTSLTCRVSFPGANVSTERTVRLSVAWPPEVWTGVLLGAAGGMCTTALLVLCLFFVLRRHRRSQEEGATGRAPGGPDCRQEYVNGSWAVSSSDSSGASDPLRKGAGAASHPPQVPQGETPHLHGQDSTTGPVYAVIKFRQ